MITRLLILSLILVCVCREIAAMGDNCMNFYRHDVTEQWLVPADSLLCTVKKPRTDEEDSYGIEAKDGQLFFTSFDFEVAIRDCPITEKGLQFDFSVSIDKPGLKIPHFFSIVVTQNESLVGTFADSCHETWDEANCRTIYYVPEGAITKPISRYLGFQVYTFAMEALVGLAAIAYPSLAVIFNTVFLFCTAFFMQQSGFIELRLFVAMALLIVVTGLFVIFLLISLGKRFYANLVGLLVILAYLRLNTSLEQFWIGVIGITSLGIGWMIFEGNSFADKYYFETGFFIAWIQQYQFWSTAQYITLPEFFTRVFFHEQDLARGYTGRNDSFNLSACLWAGGIMLACLISAVYWKQKVKKMEAGNYSVLGSQDIDMSKFA